MALDPPPDGWSGVDLDTLILRVQQHAGSQGYAVVKGRTTAFKKDGLVNEPAVATLRGRPPGAKNKQKKRTREQAFEDSTQREQSRFEHVQRQQLQRQQEAITASKVEEQAEYHLLNEFFY